MNPYGIGRGFDKARVNGWYIRVDGRKQYFASEKLRDEEHDRRLKEARIYGQSASAQVTPGDRQLLHEIRRLAAGVSHAPMEIFDLGLTLVGAKPRKTRSVESAANAMVADAKRRLKEGTLSGRRVIEIKSILGRFSAHCGKRNLHTIGRHEIELFLLGLGVGPQTRINNARTISRLFSWAGVRDNPVKITDRVHRTPPTFEPDEVERIFAVAKSDFPELVPMLALQWFAGIRPTATHTMQWSDINLDHKTIVIRPDINKLREPDLVEGLTKEFWAWASRQADKRGRIAHPNHKKLTQALHRKLGYGAGKGMRRWPEDVARHSCASHLFPIVKSIDAVAKTLCHRGARVTLKHYVVKNVREYTAARYFRVCSEL